MLRWWLLGILFDMTVVGIFVGVGLWILRVPLALALGIISGLLTFVPTFGLLISLVPAVLISLASTGVRTTILVVLLYLAAHAIESYLFAPLVQKKAVSLPPVITIMSLFAFGIVFGAVGLIVATPLTATLLAFIRIVYVENLLGDNERQETDGEPPAGRGGPVPPESSSRSTPEIGLRG